MKRLRPFGSGDRGPIPPEPPSVRTARRTGIEAAHRPPTHRWCTFPLVRCTDASIAVEFAILAPVMVTMLFGSISAARLARASMKTWTAAQSLGDLVAQQTTLTTAAMTDFCTGGKLALAPFAGALTATVASVTVSTTGTRAVDWQDTTCGGTTLTTALALAAVYTPNPGDSVIVVQATYTYTFPASYILPSSFTLTRTTYSRPRDGTKVTHA